ncbi:hypothetical protein JCM14722_20670 [Pseudodesulfovibrio portus]|uniref:Uncharacterized protein n=1 Tax=Pseudodesulfovibrio portus TaxID=231439 RepID=A0ABM8AT89_9BACT|nr:hypothetical protein JCM14722_20670 [Pseudodesulfovibrio portus]
MQSMPPDSRADRVREYSVAEKSLLATMSRAFLPWEPAEAVEAAQIAKARKRIARHAVFMKIFMLSPPIVYGLRRLRFPEVD